MKKTNINSGSVPKYTVKTSGIDAVITKDTGKSRSLLTIMPSTGTCTVRNANGTVRPLTAESYSAFMRGLKEQMIITPEGFWISCFRKGRDFGNVLCQTLENQALMDMLRKGFLKRVSYLWNPLQSWDMDMYYIPWQDLAVRAYKRCPGIFETVMRECSPKGRNFFIRWSGTAAALAEIFSDSEAVDFVKAFENSCLGREYEEDMMPYMYVSSGEACFDRDLEDYEKLCAYPKYQDMESTCSEMPFLGLTYEEFREYAVNGAARMGYTCDYKGFVDDWKKSLEMDMELYGTVNEKTPENIAAYMKMSRNRYRRCLAEYADRKAVEKLKALRAFEGESDGYLFRTPEDIGQYRDLVLPVLAKNGRHILFDVDSLYSLIKNLAGYDVDSYLKKVIPVILVFRKDFLNSPAAVVHITDSGSEKIWLDPDISDEKTEAAVRRRISAVNAVQNGTRA